MMINPEIKHESKELWFDFSDTLLAAAGSIQNLEYEYYLKSANDLCLPIGGAEVSQPIEEVRYTLYILI